MRAITAIIFYDFQGPQILIVPLIKISIMSRLRKQFFLALTYSFLTDIFPSPHKDANIYVNSISILNQVQRQSIL